MKLKPYEDMVFHPVSEKLVKILQTKTQNTNPQFFRVVTAFYFGLVAAQMRTFISGWVGKSKIPINTYSIALAPSGSGKGHSTGIWEHEILNQFKHVFTEYTFPTQAALKLEELANTRAMRNGTDLNDELTKVTKDFNSLGAYLFSFGEATSPAVKQTRQVTLMANSGACNLIVDEISINLSSSMEALGTYFELFDMGHVKEKATKSSSDNVRIEKLQGATPANLLMFGTPTKLNDGSQTEKLFMDLLEMGYARRCFFSYVPKSFKQLDITPEQLREQLYNPQEEAFLEQLSEKLGMLADAMNANKTIHLPEDSSLYLLAYQLDCERRSAALNDNETIQKGEVSNRFFKVLKLAGAYAFIDGSPEITIGHLENAIKLAEESGQAFTQLLAPERPYVKLAKYIGQSKEDLTQADLDQDLPYYRGSKAQKDEMLLMAIAWGYKNNTIIKKVYTDGILFLRGETIEQTDLNRMVLSYSADMTTGYKSEYVPFDKLDKLFKLDGFHWLNHHLVDGETSQGYRDTKNCIQGFNLLVLDVDGSVNLSTAKLLMKGYKAWYYTTKRHTETENRFRIVLPMNYTLKMDSTEYKEFVNNIRQGLPFEVDETINQQAKKWLTHDGLIECTEGELFDVLPYIPKTSKNEERSKLLQDQQSMDNLERWVINSTGQGNRNEMMHRYARILVDAGFDFDQVRIHILDLNNKLQDKLDESEITSSILSTVAKAIATRTP